MKTSRCEKIMISLLCILLTVCVTACTESGNVPTFNPNTTEVSLENPDSEGSSFSSAEVSSLDIVSSSADSSELSEISESSDMSKINETSEISQTPPAPQPQRPNIEVFPTLIATINGKSKEFKSKTETPVQCLKIQTDSDKDYQLVYRTASDGNFGTYISSLGNSQSGTNGSTITKLQILVLDKNTGAGINTGVVLLYRIKVMGTWLPWVSNATYE